MSQEPLEFIRLTAGDPAPWFTQRSCCNPAYRFDTAAGRYIVLCFFVSLEEQGLKEVLSVLETHRRLFDDEKISFFGVGIHPDDDDKLKTALPGIRWFRDSDLQISKLYGSVARNFGAREGQTKVRRLWYVLDPTLRVMKAIAIDGNEKHKEELVSFLQALPPAENFAGVTLQAPVLFLPNVLEHDLCDKLVSVYKEHGGQESGFMRDVGGKTVAIVDYKHKRRRDVILQDEELLEILRHRVRRRVAPEIEKAYFFKATRIERFLVGCYEGETGGFFNPHRDNTTKGTAHRRFAITINLNEDFEGGELTFPEYGPRSFKPPKGGAVVFSCALLHAATPVTKGTRYAFLPFLYDDAAAKVREENLGFLESDGEYEANVVQAVG